SSSVLPYTCSSEFFDVRLVMVVWRSRPFDEAPLRRFHVDANDRSESLITILRNPQIALPLGTSLQMSRCCPLQKAFQRIQGHPLIKVARRGPSVLLLS